MNEPEFGTAADLRREALTGGRIHVWRVELSADLAESDLSLLSTGERERAAGFAFPDTRRRFLASRAALRRILAAYARRDAATLQFAQGPQGKPYLLVGGDGIGTLEFNLSHSADVALVAVASGIAVGVDVEEVRPDTPTASIAARFFHPGESAALSALPVGKRTEAFFRTWTRKEALVKAQGEGLAAALNAFAVSTDPEEGVSRLAAEGEREWRIFDLTPREGFVGAVVAGGLATGVRFLRWDRWIAEGVAHEGSRSAISRAIARDEVAAGDGALRT